MQPLVDFGRSLSKGVGDAWQRLSMSARVNIGVTAAVVVGLIVALVVMASRPEYVTLFEDLSASDAAAVRSELADRGVTYRTGDQGRRIEVPLDQQSGLRTELLAKGVPASHGSLPGFELLDTSGPMTTTYLQEKNYERALRGELQRFLMEFAYVKNAAVFIREPEDELFAQNQKPAEAAVTLETTGRLSDSQVEAVLGAVSTFGGGHLTRDTITLADTNGTIYHSPAEDDFDRAASSHLELHRQWRAELKGNAEEALKLAGMPGVVTIHLAVENSTVQETSEEMMKGETVSEYTTTTESSTGEAIPEGPAGALSNLPGDSFPPGGMQTSETTEMTMVNTEPGRKVTVRDTPPGKPTVSKATVLLSAKYVDAVDEDGNATGEMAYEQRTKEELEMASNLVAAEVMVDPELIFVKDMPIGQAAVEAAAAAAMGEIAAASKWESAIELLGTLGKIALVIVGLVLIRSLLLRGIAAMNQEEEVVLDIPTASPEEMRRREIATEVERVAKDQPDQVASLLRTWMSESED